MVIYKITFSANSFRNEQPGRPYYIGQKKSPIIIDDYYGSGTLVRRYFEKYGLNSRHCKPEKAKELEVERTILAWANNREELEALEFFYIGKNHIEDDLCLNIIEGGKQGVCDPFKRKELSRQHSERLKGKYKWWNNGIEEIFQPICPKGFKNGRLNRNRETYNNGLIEIRSETCPDGFTIGRLPSNIQYGRKYSEETIKKMSQSAINQNRGRKIMCIELNKTFNNIYSALDFLRVKGHLRLNDCLRKGTTDQHGNHWKYCD